jgi:tripartite motif-containing protein 2/3
MDPCGVGIMPNDDVVVAEKKNRRLQIVTSSGKHKFFVDLNCEPFCVACDDFYNIAVSTYSGEVELYRRGGKFVNRFRVTQENGHDPDSKMAIFIAVNSQGEIIVSDSNENLIKFFNHKGDLLYKFKPVSNQEGLGVGNTGICVTPIDQIVVADGLNHLVNVYTERGALLQQMYSPIDDVGPIQTCALGPEGHFVATEFTSNGRHCLKIFRYRECECHKNRPISSKRSSRASTPAGSNGNVLDWH